jgi:hypothetical protein
MYIQTKLVKMIPASSGCQVRKRRRDGSSRQRFAPWWGVWIIVTGPRHGEIISGPCTTNHVTTPESLREGFIEFIVPSGLPSNLFL